MPSSQLYIGLMSGTSADAIDAVLVDFQASPRIIAKYSSPLDSEIRNEIHALAQPSANEIDRLGKLDIHKYAADVLSSQVCEVGVQLI